MANANVRVIFDGINLDNCIREGLQFTGTTICQYCKQPYSFEARLQKKARPSGNGSFPPADENEYEICFYFSKTGAAINTPVTAAKTDSPDDDGPCVPCSGCTMNCKKLAGR